MSHVRKQIRTAVNTILSASMVSYKYVYESRLDRERDIQPYLLVYAPTEDSQAILIHPTSIYSRDILLIVTGKVRLTNDKSTHEDTMDTVAAEIESKLTYSALNTQLNSKLKSLVLTGTDTEITIDENERSSATVTLSWRVVVHTEEGDAETLI